MGNLQESANFIRVQGDPNSMRDVDGKRSDKMYFKSTQTITLTAVALCSSISGRASAQLTISETFSQKTLITQRIDLAETPTPDNKYYDLSSSLELLKEKYYTIDVEVTGGATYTYFDSRDSSTHGYFVIELTREAPSKPLPGNAKQKVSQSPSIVASTTASTDSVMNSKKSFSEAVSISPLESNVQSPKLKRSETKDLKETQKPALDLPPALSKKSFSKKKSSESESSPANPSKSQYKGSHKVFWKERVTVMNLIAGMLFQRKVLSIGCC